MPRTATYYGYNAPFIDAGGRTLVRQEDERLVKNDLLQLLMTVPGERIMSPDFGVNLRNFPFEPADQTSMDDLRNEIWTKITTYDNRVLLKRVQVSANPDANFVSISIMAALVISPARDFLIDLNIPIGIESIRTPPQIT